MPKKIVKTNTNKKKVTTKTSRVSSRFIVGAILVLFIAVALFLRIYLPYDGIFTSWGIKFSGNDAYFNMRLVDNMVHNFPHMLSLDRYLLYPEAQNISSFFMFARLLAGISWLVGLGTPTQHVIDVVSAYVPAIMGALVVIPVYFIGKELWGRWAGLVSAALIAILPGEFLGRSILGQADHHIAETLFSTMAMLFMVMAIKAANERHLTFSHLSIRPIVYSLLAGAFMGIYLLTWIGGLLFVFIVALYFAVQFIIDHLKGQSSGYLSVVGACCFFVATIMFLPTARYSFYAVSMVTVLLLPFIFGGLTRLLTRVSTRRFYYPMAILGLGVVGLVAFYFINPSLFNVMMGMFSVFVPSSTQLTTIEMQPLLLPNGTFTLNLAWGNFGLAFFTMLISLIVSTFIAIKHGDAVKTFIVIWSIAILAMTLGQRRFGYYLAVNVALLTGYLSWLMLKWASLKEWNGDFVGRFKISKRDRRSFAVSLMVISVVTVVIILAIFAPVIPSATAIASQAQYTPSNAWCESLDWLRENSPEPFGDASAYYSMPTKNGDAYGVLSWWDYGYWITRIAHRIPNSNPGQNPATQTDVAKFFTSQNESVANEIGQRLGSEYVIIDFETVAGKFWAILRYAGKTQSDYFDVYYAEQENQLVPVQLYYPDYYRSLAIRLYNFDGKVVTPNSTIVISSQQRNSNGIAFNLITDARQFSSYNEAEAFVSSSSGYKIVGNNPFASPVPLEAIEHYELVYSSGEKQSVDGVGSISEVKIFKYKE